jgi:hypothetical protein
MDKLDEPKNLTWKFSIKNLERFQREIIMHHKLIMHLHQKMEIINLKVFDTSSTSSKPDAFQLAPGNHKPIHREPSPSAAECRTKPQQSVTGTSGHYLGSTRRHAGPQTSVEQANPPY